VVVVGNVGLIDMVQDGKKPWKTKCICDEGTLNDRPLDQSFQGLQTGHQTLELSFDKPMKRMGRNLMLRSTSFVTYRVVYGLQKTFGFASLGLTARPLALSQRPSALQHTLLLEPKTPKCAQWVLWAANNSLIGRPVAFIDSCEAKFLSKFCN
jgi:hypothetical protein